MTFYVSTIGQLLIIEAFVFFIWCKVMFDSMKSGDGSLGHKKVLLTSIGLVISSAAVFGIMAVRLYETEHDGVHVLWAVTLFYVMLAIGNFLLLISAALGTKSRIVYAFLTVSILWVLYSLSTLLF